MDITLKNKTEIEYDKSKNEKLLYEIFNQEDAFLDLYDQPAESGDLANLMNSAYTEVNKDKLQIYKTENNLDAPETFDMILSSNK